MLFTGVNDVEKYIVKQKPGDIEYTTTDTMIEISYLSPYTIYVFSVRAINNVGSRGYSDEVQIRTGV